jgi:hypothetical protein
MKNGGEDDRRRIGQAYQDIFVNLALEEGK